MVLGHDLLLLLPLLIGFSNIVTSQSIIKNLPGFDGDLPFNLETGYVGVGYNEEVQLFYYFVESERNPKDDPLVLWFTAGPGCSSLSAILYQHGPLHFNYANPTSSKPTLVLNPHSWTKVANIIYLDAPVGTGFSYATTWRGYNIGDLSSAAQTYDFLRKWLMAHPKFLSNPMYVGSDSYGGLVVPIIVQEITTGNDKGNKPKINLKGYILGNPVTDYKNDLSSRIPYAHQKALISSQLYESIKESCKGEYLNPDRSNKICISNLQAVNKTFEELYLYNILEPKCRSWDLSPLLGGTDLLTLMKKIDVFAATQLSREWCRDYMLLYSHIWANDKSVQSALHVREGTITEWPRCNLSLRYDFDVLSVVQYHRNFTKTSAYRVLIFSGDHDLALPYLATYAWIQTLNLTVTKNWQPWLVDHQVAGHVIAYSKRKYNLTFAIVQGGSHSASEIRPKECFAMIDRWLAYKSL
ncbi:hypothetical protein JCGZ_16363 [Jatropha curcas]|uniref:Uncharacterized protein n=1 Tax=Jatropha curcas TaxID=180498 RepID=A0A067LIR8_JATCU|nr:hypothetical protein JCGZ_16363 [Jatropha curcas]